MLHFIIGLAVCIWIAERVWHYCSEWRWRRQQRRYVRWLQGEDIRTGLPPWVTPFPKSATVTPPDPAGRALSLALWSVGCIAVIFTVLLVTH